jgi:hypothetical protein
MTEAAPHRGAMDGDNETRILRSWRWGLVKINSTERDDFLPQMSKNNPFVGVKIRLGDQSPKNEKIGGLKEL